MTSKSDAVTLPEIVQIVVVPAIVRRAADVHRRAVVGHDHPVFLERRENHLIRRGKSGNIEAGFQAQTHAHRRGDGIRRIRGPMRRGRHECGAARLQREAQRVVDLAGGDFVVARQAGKDRQACGVGGSPRVGALLVSRQVPDGGGCGVPTRRRFADRSCRARRASNCYCRAPARAGRRCRARDSLRSARSRESASAPDRFRRRTP